jgi:hypothetical protein
MRAVHLFFEFSEEKSTFHEGRSQFPRVKCGFLPRENTTPHSGESHFDARKASPFRGKLAFLTHSPEGKSKFKGLF